MNEMMSSGVEIMMVGMGIVFLFLAMLIVAVNIMSALVQRFVPDITEELIPSTAVDTDPNVIAAISVAVHQYRNKHKS